MQHIIQKQTLDIRLEHNDRAIEQQQAFRKLYWERLVPAMDKVFSELIPAGQTLRLEYLELNLGTIPEEQLEAKIIQLIKEQLRELTLKAELSSHSGSIKMQTAVDEKQQAHLIHQKEADWKALIFFLKNGIYPWWFATQSSPPSPSVLLEHCIKKRVDEIILFFQKNTNPIIWERLEKQFTASQLQTVLRTIQNTSLSNFEPIIQLKDMLLQQEIIFLLKKEELTISVSKWKEATTQSFKKIICALIKEQLKTNTINPIVFIQRFIKIFIEKTKISPAQLHTALQTITNSKIPAISVSQRSDLKRLIKILEQQFILKNENPAAKARSSTSENSTKQSVENSSNSTTLEKKHKLRKSNSENPIAKIEFRKLIEEGVFVNNAGLVLIAPFLSRYFERLNLLENDNFTNTETQERAVQLSQYLLTGATHFSEQDGFLNKVLCGWPPEEPIQTTLELDETMIKESEALLKAIIQHWGALGNSSIAALREGYLQREAKLVDLTEQYKLIVERKTLDILMDKIPWSFHAIKLPWMEKRLLVEW